MTIPSAMVIKMAIASLPEEDAADTAAKTKELHVATNDGDPAFVRGYLLGLKMAELLLAMRGIAL